MKVIDGYGGEIVVFLEVLDVSCFLEIVKGVCLYVLVCVKDNVE